MKVTIEVDILVDEKVEECCNILCPFFGDIEEDYCGLFQTTLVPKDGTLAYRCLKCVQITQKE